MVTLKQTVGESQLRNQGEGPGAQTVDGCSVEFYRQLTADAEELRCIELGLSAPATLLELGCGVGRLTKPLMQRGYHITAVDNSPEMLECAPADTRILSDIEHLNLQERFDGVLMASRLLNCPKEEVRGLLVTSARRHLLEGGTLIVEVQPKSLLSLKAGDEGVGPEYSAKIVSSNITGNCARATIEYRIGEQTWRHSYEAEYLAQDQLEALMQASGFKFTEWINSEKSWFKATAV